MSRMNCNLIHSIKHRYFWSMIKYCKQHGWWNFRIDNFGFTKYEKELYSLRKRVVSLEAVVCDIQRTLREDDDHPVDIKYPTSMLMPDEIVTKAGE